MVPVKQVVWLLLAAALVLPLISGHAAPVVADEASTSLYAQSASQALTADFPSSDISYILVDARTSRVLASRWDHADATIPMGSLLKPFTAVAYGEQHGHQFPTHRCRGTATGCWLPRGHGDMDLTNAVAHSCNSYFRMLTEDLSAEDVAPTATRFGLEAPEGISGAELAGLGGRWRTSPMRLVHGYLELIRERKRPGVSEVVDGMELSARQGTGAAVHRVMPARDALVKTGTAACTHARRSPGDGMAVVMMPADDPNLLLLVRVHGVPGALAAKTAGEMLNRIGN